MLLDVDLQQWTSEVWSQCSGIWQTKRLHEKQTETDVFNMFLAKYDDAYVSVLYILIDHDISYHICVCVGVCKNYCSTTGILSNLQLKLRLLKHGGVLHVSAIWLSARNPHKTHGVCSTNLPPCFSAPMTVFPFLLSRLSHFWICATVRRQNPEQRWPWETIVRAFYKPSFLIVVYYFKFLSVSSIDILLYLWPSSSSPSSHHTHWFSALNIDITLIFRITTS